jgi:lycopene beta-cyclase
LNLSRPSFTHAFVGMGCANSLLLHALHRNGLLENSRLLVIDPEPKTTNDRTFCFWLSPAELQANGLESLVEYSWGQVICNDQAPQQLSNQRYYYLSAAKLYAHAKAILAQHEFTWQHHVADGDLSELASHVFDSRPPEWKVQHASETLLKQSFFGWEVRTAKPIFDPLSFTMMDFSIAQNEQTQFMYVLPFDAQQALLEPTRFGREAISKQEALGLIETYLAPFDTTFELISQEQGIIPMCSAAPFAQESATNVHRMGAGAGQLKPSTGYSFVRNLHDANALVKSFQEKASVLSRREVKPRFAYYDRLLLQILAKKPQSGKEIFQKLFAQNEAQHVLNFLDERSTPLQEARLMLTLPIFLFLGAAFKDLWFNSTRLVQKVSPALWICSISLIGNYYGQNQWSWPLLAFGLLLVGLPHGAIDHLHQFPGKKWSQLLPYFGFYVVLGIGVLFFWWISPPFALVVFLAYSAWHFGQADLEIWKLQHPALRHFLWGAFSLLFFLSTHFLEVKKVLFEMGIVSKMESIAAFQGYFTTSPFWLLLGLAPLIVFKSWRIIESLFVLFLLSYLPLIEAFGIYFIFQHSWNGWRYLTQITAINPLQLWWQALPFTLASIGLFAGYYFWSATQNWGLLFIFLSALSFPHVFFMHRAYATRK